MKPVLAAIASLLVSSCGSSPKQAEPVKPPVVEAPAPVVAPVKAMPAQVAIPSTPAGKALRAFLEAFNSADEARLQAFVTTYKWNEMPVAALLGFRQETGGFDLISIEKSDGSSIAFVVKEKQSPTTALGWLQLKNADAEIDKLGIQAIPPGLTAAQMNMKLDGAARDRILDAVIAKLTELYVFPETAKKMAEELRVQQRKAAYDGFSDARAFAVLLTEQLQAVSHDKHLHVDFEPRVVPADAGAEPSDEDKARFKAEMERNNCGFRKSERLDGNIGYIKFDFFGDVEICGPKATAALDALGDVDALIFDLRENGGGQPDMVAFVSSRLFAKRTHLNDIYERKENKTTQYWTKPEVAGKKFPTQPVFVLTSNRTFSGAEEFTYNLKNLKRATIIGETTGGGAHPTMGARLDDHFTIGVPFARAINPITKTNWEGTGVEPDVKVPADQALETAKKLAAERLAQKKTKRAK